MKMRFCALSILLGGGVALFVSGAAGAADLDYREPPSFAAPVPTWAGFYVGGNAGGFFGRGDDDVDFGDTTGSWTECTTVSEEVHKVIPIGCGKTKIITKTITKPVCKTHNCVFDKNKARVHDEAEDSGFIGGVQAGYNWQRGNIVYGVEGDADFADNIDYLASVRGRLGYATGRWLFYATAGVAFIGQDNGFKISYDGKTTKYKDDDSDVGFVVGAGAEVKVSQNVSLGVEGLYYNFDGDDTRGSFTHGPKNACETTFSRDGDDDFFVVRGRLSYHFQPAYEPLK